MKVNKQNMILPTIPSMHKANTTRSGKSSLGKGSQLSKIGSKEDQNEQYRNEVIHIEDFDASVDVRFARD